MGRLAVGPRLLVVILAGATVFALSRVSRAEDAPNAAPTKIAAAGGSGLVAGGSGSGVPGGTVVQAPHVQAPDNAPGSTGSAGGPGSANPSKPPARVDTTSSSQPPTSGDGDQNSQNRKPEPPPVDMKSLVIISGMIVLMGGLFFFLFSWQQRMRRANYLVGIYQDAVQASELQRLAGPVQDRWDQGVFLIELVLQRTSRAASWLERHPKPQPGPKLTQLASALGRQYEIWQAQKSMEYPDFAEVGRYAWQSGMNRRPGGTEPPSFAVSAADEAQQQTFVTEKREYLRRVEEWVNLATGEARSWYEEELSKAERRAKDQADKALSFDFSAWDRGPEFVLEFTAVVVIIFAAVILGIGGKLDSQQIGTLLAAIAGYVLGKSTARARSDVSQEQRKVEAMQPLRTGSNDQTGRNGALPSGVTTGHGTGAELPAAPRPSA